MDKIGKSEILVILALAIVFCGILFPSLKQARREYRDGIRRDELAVIKQTLEQENNNLGYYPLSVATGQHQYIVTHQEGQAAISWFLRAQLENEAEPYSGFDMESGRNYYYRIVENEGKIYYEICGGEATCIEN